MEFFIPISSEDALLQSNPSFFQVCLPQRLILEGDFEIGLLEISIPCDLYTLVTQKDAEVIIHSRDSEEKKLYLQRKSYLSILDFVEELNDLISAHSDDIKILMGENNLIQVEALNSYVSFSPLIRDILGLKTDTVIYSTAYSASFPNMQQQHNFINICVDVVNPLFYGKRNFQLLRRFQFFNSNKRYLMKTFEYPIYFPVCKKEFETISVQITNDYGNPVSFDRGTVFMLVHIRERR